MLHITLEPQSKTMVGNHILTSCYIYLYDYFLFKESDISFHL